jgi:CRISPR-associated protein Cmr6
MPNVFAYSEQSPPDSAAFAMWHTFPTSDFDSKNIGPHFDGICKIPSSDLYTKAYERWNLLWRENAAKPLTLAHRMLIGLSNPSLWETSITLNPVYGTPFIPGNAVKGLARRFARNTLLGPEIDEDVLNVVFGDTFGIALVRFHDAWWVPNSAPGSDKNRPLVREIVTPHHQQFMATKGVTPATPFDSPVPVPQLATHGTYLFVLEGSPLFVELAFDILKRAATEEGFGARTPEYGHI